MFLKPQKHHNLQACDNFLFVRAKIESAQLASTESDFFSCKVANKEIKWLAQEQGRLIPGAIHRQKPATVSNCKQGQPHCNLISWCQIKLTAS